MILKNVNKVNVGSHLSDAFPIQNDLIQEDRRYVHVVYVWFLISLWLFLFHLLLYY
jgi:hypothetical protein